MDGILNDLRKIDQSQVDVLHFVRTLAIVRQKNLSRGANSKQDRNSSADNPLHGIVEWVKVGEPMPLIKSDNPILYVRGEKLTDSTGGVIF
ncbi:uncharacterized protein LOC119769181 [Culex quinquefasciatus]|uniref:uncharacterized protein LOC119769181 n=1 Tax=Culex quinquefasciatus TaxID=7176 RepID=UPI0018E365DD|nr:uncharacterized protein LOC119769181 [Culex quinquefasciatus]